MDVTLNSLAVSTTALITPTLLLVGFISTLPILYLLNFYIRYKRHQAAMPWTPKDKVVIITGASSGIGESLAYEFARQGAKLHLCSRRVEKLANVAKVCQEKCGAKDVTIHRVDVTSESDVMRTVETIGASSEKIDCIVLNAGVSMGQTLESFEEYDDIKKIVDVNFHGSAMFAYFALPFLKKAEKSRIVVVSSLVGTMPSIPFRTGYAASKYALKGFFESLQSEVIDQNIFITIAYPGIVKTEIGKNRLGSNPVDMDYSGAISPEECAKIIIDGAIKGHKEIIFTNLAKFGKVIEGAFPDLLSYLSYKKTSKLLHHEKKSE